jgi:hypothetical protein
VPILDDASEAELAERMDQRAADIGGLFSGVGMAEVRAARRADARGDRERAAEVAARVRDALRAADIPVAVVSEVEALVEPD